MSYTLEQKREASNRNELWWRFPNETWPRDRAWSLCSCGFSCSEAEYFIGPTPPRVLSELEGELLEALKAMVSCWRSVCLSHGWDPEHVVEAARAKAAIQKAESTP